MDDMNALGSGGLGPMLLVGGVIVIVLRLVFGGRKAEVDEEPPPAERPLARHLTARDVIEGRMFDLMDEFPELQAAAIAQLVHDELMNSKSEEPELFRWATAETAARVMRTRVVAAERARRAAENSSAD